MPTIILGPGLDHHIVFPFLKSRKSTWTLLKLDIEKKPDDVTHYLDDF